MIKYKYNKRKQGGVAMTLIHEISDFAFEFGNLISNQPTSIKVILLVNLLFVLYIVMEKNIENWKELKSMIS